MRNLITIACLFIVLIINAQEPVINSSRELNKEYRTSFWSEVLGQDDTGYYLLSTSNIKEKGRWYLEKYTPDLKRSFRKKIDQRILDMSNNVSHHSTQFKNGKIYMFLSTWKKADKKGRLLVKTIDKDGNISDEEFKIGEASAKNYFKKAGYWVDFSPDGSKIVVLTQNEREKKENEKIRLEVFSTVDFKSLWKKDITLETPASKVPKNKLRLNNDGTAYLFKIKKQDKDNHSFNLHVYNTSLEQVNTIDLKDRYPREEHLRIDGDGNFIMHGMLVPKKRKGKGGWSDTWYLVADKTGKMVTNQIEPLGKEFLSNMFNEKQAGKENLTLSNFYLKDVLVKSDGGFYLLTQRRIVKSTAPNIKTSSYQIENKGAYVFSYNAQGEREWETFIPVRQTETTTNKNVTFGSYAYRLWEDKVYLIWNYTDPYDEEIAEHFVPVMKSGKSLYPSLITAIDKDGSIITRNEGPANSTVLPDLNKDNIKTMAVDPDFSFPSKKGMILLSRMGGVSGGYYKLSEIEF